MSRTHARTHARSQAILFFGAQRFRMQLCRAVHGIRVDVEGENPLIVKERLCSQVC